MISDSVNLAEAQKRKASKKEVDIRGFIPYYKNGKEAHEQCRQSAIFTELPL
jgi:hypothetical protein